MNTIYFVTVIHDTEKRKRCWGWYKDLNDAEKAVLRNHTDIYERGYSNLAVIEEFPEGVMAVEENRWWYRATYAKGQDDPRVERISSPPMFEGTCCLSIG